ncbi:MULTISPECIES: hypothetical protein [Arthrobacter]|uniref:Uncharacterized protein n=2 Tax=Arthrobacter TaxID=1663 RepID=A0ABU9KQD4_9MICC|nr:hypothetical protein [Arthrobacter sp. YJM1]MDP5228114.1 hypothetical protein [Arthrobacter sp. YJM1]
MSTHDPRPEDEQENTAAYELPLQPPTLALGPLEPEPRPGAQPGPQPAPHLELPTPPHAPSSWSYTPPPEHRGPRVGTVVWGLLLMALATLLVISRMGLVVLDGGEVLIWLMLGTGAALLVGGLVSAAGRKNRDGRDGVTKQN